jgi:pimeloyl-ACP methyl ester carboxylesterase
VKSWVLLRGLTREARHWGTLPPRLASELGGATVLTPDLEGNGVRHRERSPATIGAYAAACRAALHAAGYTPPHVLLGHSLGGMVAMSWATCYPQDVCGLVLVNTSARGTGPWYRRLRPRALGVLARIAMSSDVRARERAVLELTACHPPATPEVIASDWARWYEERPVSLGNALRQLVASARFALPSAAAGVPVLVLASERDALVDPACSHALADAWNARLLSHPTAGHDLPLDDPAWVAHEVARWWRDVS